MFDVGFSELLIFGIIALVVLGPEKLHHSARIIGAWVARIRRSVSTIQEEIEREVAAQELKSKLDKEFQHLGGASMFGALQEAPQKLEEAALQLRKEFNNTANSQTSTPYTPVVNESTPHSPQTPEEARDLLAQTTIEDVKLDGEAAYKEWLANQRRANLTKKESTPS